MGMCSGCGLSLCRCSGGKDEDDFRPLFENFIQDLLTTLNLPMWPASEVLLTLLGKLLVYIYIHAVIYIYIHAVVLGKLLVYI